MIGIGVYKHGRAGTSAQTGQQHRARRIQCPKATEVDLFASPLGKGTNFGCDFLDPVQKGQRPVTGNHKPRHAVFRLDVTCRRIVCGCLLRSNDHGPSEASAKPLPFTLLESWKTSEAPFAASLPCKNDRIAACEYRSARKRLERFDCYCLNKQPLITRRRV